ncbi:hypothetical protein ACTFIT_009201 [Dictyostelium discoideum]
MIEELIDSIKLLRNLAIEYAAKVLYVNSGDALIVKNSNMMLEALELKSKQFHQHCVKTVIENELYLDFFVYKGKCKNIKCTRGNKARKNSIVCSVYSDMVNQAIEQLRELIKIN